MTKVTPTVALCFYDGVERQNSGFTSNLLAQLEFTLSQHQWKVIPIGLGGVNSESHVMGPFDFPNGCDEDQVRSFCISMLQTWRPNVVLCQKQPMITSLLLSLGWYEISSYGAFVTVYSDHGNPFDPAAWEALFKGPKLRSDGAIEDNLGFDESDSRSSRPLVYRLPIFEVQSHFEDHKATWFDILLKDHLAWLPPDSGLVIVTDRLDRYRELIQKQRFPALIQSRVALVSMGDRDSLLKLLGECGNGLMLGNKQSWMWNFMGWPFEAVSQLNLDDFESLKESILNGFKQVKPSMKAMDLASWRDVRLASSTYHQLKRTFEELPFATEQRFRPNFPLEASILSQWRQEDTEFVRSLFEYLLRRQPTNSEIAYWKVCLNLGISKAFVFLELVNHEECPPLLFGGLSFRVLSQIRYSINELAGLYADVASDEIWLRRMWTAVFLSPLLENGQKLWLDKLKKIGRLECLNRMLAAVGLPKITKDEVSRHTFSSRIRRFLDCYRQDDFSHLYQLLLLRKPTPQEREYFQPFNGLQDQATIVIEAIFYSFEAYQIGLPRAWIEEYLKSKNSLSDLGLRRLFIYAGRDQIIRFMCFHRRGHPVSDAEASIWLEAWKTLGGRWSFVRFIQQESGHHAASGPRYRWYWPLESTWRKLLYRLKKHVPSLRTRYFLAKG